MSDNPGTSDNPGMSGTPDAGQVQGSALPPWASVLDAGSAHQRYQVRRDDGELNVHTLGAQVTSWVSGGREVLWTSATAEYAVGSDIRGGVPVIYPWFANGPDGERRPNHGLARLVPWEFAGRAGADGEAGGSVDLRFGLGGPGESRPAVLEGIPEAEQWPAGTRAELAVLMQRDRLMLQLTLLNYGDQPVSCEAALHTYFAVSDVEAVEIDSLEGAAFYDKVARRQDTHVGPIPFGDEIDRVYETTVPVVLRDGAHRLRISGAGGNRTVVWNPGREKGPTLADVSDWRAFVCVEAAAIGPEALIIPAARPAGGDGGQSGDTAAPSGSDALAGRVTLSQEIVVLA